MSDRLPLSGLTLQPPWHIDPWLRRCPRGALGGMVTRCNCGSDHTSNLSQEDTRAIARVLYAVHQRRAARLAAAEGAEVKQSTWKRKPA